MRNPISVYYARVRRQKIEAAVGGLYSQCRVSYACEYCGGAGLYQDHVPPLVVLAAMSARERAKETPVLVRCCRRCNGVLSRCRSGSVSERVEWVRDWERRRAGAMAGYQVVVRAENFEVRLTGWRNAYVAFVREGEGEPWVQLASASSRGVLCMELVAKADVAEAALAACAALPDSPRDCPTVADAASVAKAAPIAVRSELLELRLGTGGKSYRLFARASKDAPWERLFGAATKSSLVRRLEALGVDAGFRLVCGELPELPAEWLRLAAFAERKRRVGPDGP